MEFGTPFTQREVLGADLTQKHSIYNVFLFHKTICPTEAEKIL